VRFIQQYYNDYNSLPKPEQIEAETGQIFQEREVTRDKVAYCSKEIETFCRDQALRQSIMNAAAIYEEGDKDKFPGIQTLVTEALMISLVKDLGTSMFEDVNGTLQRLILGGGLARKQMLLMSANSGGGKSILMANLALNYVTQGKTAVYISLELSEDMIYQRYIAMIAGVSTREWQHQVDDVAHKISAVGDKSGGLYIKRMAQGSNSNQIRAYLKEFELKNGVIPDVIAVDYIDLMGSNEKVSADNVHEKDKRASEELREIMNDYNAVGMTASQQNRGAVNATELNHSHIAGGISKINTTDVYISIIMTDTMRAKGEMAIQFLKTRSSDGVGQTIHLDYNKITLRITDPNSLNLPTRRSSAPTEVVEIDKGNDLLGLLSSING
jgi:KaiC/GvpD/RAD55 family RecA-like ATPase